MSKKVRKENNRGIHILLRGLICLMLLSGCSTIRGSSNSSEGNDSSSPQLQASLMNRQKWQCFLPNLMYQIQRYKSEPKDDKDSPNPELEQDIPERSTSHILNIEVGSHKFTATLEDNPSSEAFKAMLPITVEMNDMNNNEKYYDIPDSLPTNSKKGGNIKNGDIMLYGSDCLVLFYESFSSSYHYTRLGVVDDPSGLVKALGSGAVTITWSLAE